jgi:hypothetical protein
MAVEDEYFVHPVDDADWSSGSFLDGSKREKAGRRNNDPAGRT